MTTAIDTIKEATPLPTDAIQDLIGYEPESPTYAAERDVKDIMHAMSAEFEALVNSIVEGRGTGA